MSLRKSFKFFVIWSFWARMAAMAGDKYRAFPRLPQLGDVSGDDMAKTMNHRSQGTSDQEKLRGTMVVRHVCSTQMTNAMIAEYRIRAARWILALGMQNTIWFQSNDLLNSILQLHEGCTRRHVRST
jgi:hypothetical protein